MKCVSLLESVLIILWNGHLLTAIVAALGQPTQYYGPNPLVELFTSKDLGHKVVAKSVEIKTITSDDGKEMKASSRSFHYHEGRGEGSSSSRKLSAESIAVSNNANGAVDDGEEDILQEIIAARRDALRMRVRNSSELHIDNHDEGTEPIPKSSSNDPMNDVVVLPQPFHFHIPIISNPAPAKQKPQKAERKVAVKKMVPLQSIKSKRGGKDDEDDAEVLETKIKASSSEENPSMATYQTQSGGIGKRNVDEPQSNKEAPASSVDNGPFHALRNPKVEKDSTEERMKTDLDALIEQHPKLIPPVNRKRNSGHGERQDVVDDETHHYMMIFKKDMNNDDLLLPQDDVKITSFKREVKNLNFSQGVVDSILGHEDDLVKYRNNIQSHAEKLGVQPHEVFHKVVYGNSSDVPNKNKADENSTSLEIQKRRQQFQQLFLSGGDESGKHGNEIALEGQNVANDDGNHANRYSAYMKILKREKRGLKSWFKKLFKKSDNNEEKPTTRATTARAPKRKHYSDEDHDFNYKPKKHKTVYHVEVDRQGNTPVDLLLPVSLRRSTYLKKKDEIKSRAKEDEEIEEEEEKSEEREVKRRNTSNENDDGDGEDNETGRKERKKKERKKRVHKRSIVDDRIAPIAENMKSQQGSDKLLQLSKDEILLVHEMLLNIINFRCGEITRSIIDNLLSITQVVVGMSNLPKYINERRDKVESLFDQILSCSSNEEHLSRWGYSRQEGKGVVGLSDVPHKRIKRIRRRRRRNEMGKEENQKEDKLGEIRRTSSGGAVIPKLLKLHVLIYKLILETCWEIVDPELLHESQLILVEEFIRISKIEENKEEVEDFANRIDAASVEQMFQGCFKRKE